jgi:hypothetical protein
VFPVGGVEGDGDGLNEDPFFRWERGGRLVGADFCLAGLYDLDCFHPHSEFRWVYVKYDNTINLMDGDEKNFVISRGSVRKCMTISKKKKKKKNKQEATEEVLL